MYEKLVQYFILYTVFHTVRYLSFLTQIQFVCETSLFPFTTNFTCSTSSMAKKGKRTAGGPPVAKPVTKDKLKKLEEENMRLKLLVEQQQGKSPRQQEAGTKRRSGSGAEGEAKRRKAAEQPEPTKKLTKKSVSDESGSKSKGHAKEESNFMKMIREQGLASAGSASGKGDKGSKAPLQAALEEDLREIEELKQKLGSNWRGELAEDGWLDLFDSFDNLGEDSGNEDDEVSSKKQAKSKTASKRR